MHDVYDNDNSRKEEDDDDGGGSKFSAQCNININIPISKIDALIRLLQAVNGENNGNTVNFTISPKYKNGEIAKRHSLKGPAPSTTHPFPATEQFNELPVPTLEKVLSILKNRYDSGIIKGQQFRSGEAKAFVLKESGLGRSTFAKAIQYGLEKQKVCKISHGAYQFVQDQIINKDVEPPTTQKENLLDISIDGNNSNSESLSLFLSILKAISKTTQRVNLYFGNDKGISARFKNGSNPYSMIEFTMPKEAFSVFHIQNNQNVKMGFFLSDLIGHLSITSAAASFRITLADRSSEFFKFNELFQFKVLECEVSGSQFQTQKAIMPLIKPEVIVTLPRSLLEDILKNAKGVSDTVKISCLPDRITFEAIGEYSKFEKEVGTADGCSLSCQDGLALELSFDIEAMLSLLLHGSGGNIRLEFAKDVMVIHHILDSRFTLSNYVFPIANQQQAKEEDEAQTEEKKEEMEMVPDLAM